MKQLVWVLAGLLTLLSLLLALGLFTGGAEGFAYVISGSMEPTLHVGDGFLLWPARDPQVGDVITYRPVVLQAKSVTHRIIGVGPDGFITRGDHNLETDQAGGEPPVSSERVIGKAVSFRGQILRIPQLGPLSQALRNFLRRRLWIVAAGLVGMSMFLGFLDQAGPIHRRRPRRRWRLGMVHGALALGAVGGLLVAMIIGVQVEQVDFLASMDPGDVANHVPVGKPGTVRMKVTNGGLLPVFGFAEGLNPAVAVTSPEQIAPRSAATLILHLPPIAEPGWYREYVRLYRYPPLLPYWAVAALHRLSPYLAMFGLMSSLAVVLWIPTRFLNLWTPLGAMRDKRTPRVLRRALRFRPSRRRIG